MNDLDALYKYFPELTDDQKSKFDRFFSIGMKASYRINFYNLEDIEWYGNNYK